MLPRLNELAAPFLADGRLWRIAVDTYEREVERYGGEGGIELAESLFEADSDAALAIVGRLESESGADERWRLSLRGCHELLVDLGLDLAARTDVVRRAYETLGVELRVDKALERALGARFRAERASLDEVLVAEAASDHRLSPGLVALAERSARARSIVEELRARERSGRLTVPVRDLAAGFLRMHCNRLLRSDLRAQELVIYEFLHRLYVSEAARGRSPGSAAKPERPT
jgi:thiopeptide-type bacteriocin biosynthesis protein